METVYVINMPERSDRRLHMTDLLHRLGYTDDNIIFLADIGAFVDATPETVYRLEQIGVIAPPTKQHKILRRTEVSCLANHITCLVHMLKNNRSRAIIMEDDVEPCHDDSSVTRRRIDECLRYVDRTPGLDMFYLEYCHEACSCSGHVDGSKNIVVMNHPFCAAAYIMTHAGALKVLREGLPATMSIDDTYGMLINKGKLVAHGAAPHQLVFKQSQKFGTDNQLRNITSDSPPVCRSVSLSYWPGAVLFVCLVTTAIVMLRWS